MKSKQMLMAGLIVSCLSIQTVTMGGDLYRDMFGTIRDKGDMFYQVRTRGSQVESNLFADKVFASKFNDGAWVEAVQTRNVPAMASLAWNLKGVETILGKVDKKTTSAMMFEAAAKIAVAQGNADALKDIVALAPECKKFDEEMALAGKTRGISKPIAMPELCVYDPAIGDKLMKPWQRPILGDYITDTFRGMPKQNAESISFLVNQGRMTMNPAMLAFGAMELHKFRGDNKISAQFEPANIMAEAADMAVEVGDKEALKTIIAIYETSPLANAEKVAELKEQMNLLSATRGADKQNVLKDLCQGLKWNVNMPAMTK